MNKVLFLALACSLVTLSFAATSTTAAGKTACNATLANCGGQNSTYCVLYNTLGASGATTADAAGEHCITAASGYQVYTAAALADATGVTSDTICSTTCINGYCTTGAATCIQCASGNGVANASGYIAPGVNQSTPVTCAACKLGTNNTCATCLSDIAVCSSCFAGQYGTGNTTAPTTLANTTSYINIWSAGTGPTACVSCNASIPGALSCTNSSVALACNTTAGYTLSGTTCKTKAGAKLAAVFGVLSIALLALAF